MGISTECAGKDIKAGLAINKAMEVSIQLIVLL